MRILLASLLLLAGCAPQSASTPSSSSVVAENYSRLSSTYPTFTSKLSEVLQREADKYGLSGKEALIKCSAMSFVKGIPDTDLALMDTAMETRQLTPERKAAFVKWMDPGFTHGDKSGQNYTDGTPRNYAAENAITSRVQANAKDLCPDLLAQYPVAFRY